MTDIVKVFNLGENGRAVQLYRDGKLIREDDYFDQNGDGKFSSNERFKTSVFDVKPETQTITEGFWGDDYDYNRKEKLSEQITVHLTGRQYLDHDGDGKVDDIRFEYESEPDKDGIVLTHTQWEGGYQMNMPKAIEYSEKDIVNEEYEPLGIDEA